MEPNPRARPLRITYILGEVGFLMGAAVLAIVVGDPWAGVFVASLLTFSFAITALMMNSPQFLPRGRQLSAHESRVILVGLLAGTITALATLVGMAATNSRPPAVLLLALALIGFAVGLYALAAIVRS